MTIKSIPRPLVHITDLHIFPYNHIPSGRNPNLAYDYQIEELETLKSDLLALNPLAILVSGDIFHYKNPLYYPPSLLSYLIEYFSSFPCPILSIPGNHDLPSSSLDNLDHSPYKLLSLSIPNFHTLTLDSPYILKPYAIYGLPYHDLENTVSLLSSFRPTDSQPYKVCLVHSDFVADNEIPLPFKVLSEYSLPYINPHITHWCLGHIHLSFPPLYLPPLYVKPLGNTEITYPHSLYLISKPWSIGRVQNDWFNITDQHIPSYSILTKNSLNYKLLSSYKLSSELFLEKTLRKEVESREQFKEFVDNLSSINLESGSYTPELSPRLFSILEEYLHKADEIKC